MIFLNLYELLDYIVKYVTNEKTLLTWHYLKHSYTDSAVLPFPLFHVSPRNPPTCPLSFDHETSVNSSRIYMSDSKLVSSLSFGTVFSSSKTFEASSIEENYISSRIADFLSDSLWLCLRASK